MMPVEPPAVVAVAPALEEGGRAVMWPHVSFPLWFVLAALLLNVRARPEPHA